MLQSQRVPYFMGQNQLDQFALHRVGQQDIPSIGVIGPALYEIPFLENIQYTAENTDMTTDDLSRPRFAGSGSVSIVLTGYFPRYKWIGGVIHAKFRVFGSIRCQSRSEEHTSELQSRQYLVCRLLLEKKKKII